MITSVLIGRENTVPFLRSIPGSIDAELRQAVESLAIKLTGYIKKNKLSGTMLKNRSGILRGSIHPTMEFSANSIYGRVGTNKEYAAVHEYGFDGVVTVREHLRMMVKAFGHTVKNPHAITIRSHAVHMRIPERSYLRSSLREMDSEIRTKLAEALRKGARLAK